MARATLAAAALLLLLAAAAAEDKCPPGCGTCTPMTADEIAALKAKKEAKRATWKAKLASIIGKDVNGDGKIDAADAPSRGEGQRREGKPDKVWQKCLTCSDTKATTLKEGRCVCNPGFGFPLPKPDANGKPVKPTTPPTCSACIDNTVSGPDAPKPDWAALGFKRPDWAAAAGKTGGRHLLGMGHGRGSFCVPCPAETTASADATKCAPK